MNNASRTRSVLPDRAGAKSGQATDGATAANPRDRLHKRLKQDVCLEDRVVLAWSGVGEGGLFDRPSTAAPPKGRRDPPKPKQKAPPSSGSGVPEPESFRFFDPALLMKGKSTPTSSGRNWVVCVDRAPPPTRPPAAPHPRTHPPPQKNPCHPPPPPQMASSGGS
jgi:hypothetical protein